MENSLSGLGLKARNLGLAAAFASLLALPTSAALAEAPAGSLSVIDSFAALGTAGMLPEVTPDEPLYLPQTLPQAEARSYLPVGNGMASYYGRELAGRRTASGEVFNPSLMTAAHRTLPLGSLVRVTNPQTGDSVMVRINDRGPYHGNRVIDLSEAAAREVGIWRRGSGMVQLAVAAP